MAHRHHTQQLAGRSSPRSTVQSAQTSRRISTPLLLQRAYADPSSLTATDVKHLQRTVGNRATIGILSKHTGLQAKLKLGPAGDQYEQEADRVASQVVRRIDDPQPVQRQTAEEEELQMKPLARSISTLQRKDESRPKMVFTKSMFAQRQEEEEELQMKPLHGPEGGDVEQSVEQQIQTARRGGKPLDDNIRRSMEQGFGADFSGVRVHTGGQADALNRSLNAKAFTVGNDVFFGKGQYNPGSSSGKQLLAHELTHTVQQGGAGVQRDTIQRAIGFEFEFGTWQTWHNDGKTRLTKGEEIYKGNGYKVEGEDAGEDTSAIEIVTKPYVTEKEAVKSVREAQKWMKKVSNESGRTNTRVRASKHGGKSGVRIQPGENKGKMQASPAIALGKMSELYKKGLGSTYAGFANSISNYLGRDEVKHRYLNDQDATNELIGLVTLIVDYLTQGASKAQLSYPKSAFRIMARTSFTKMFKLVPEFEFFSDPQNLDKWVNLVLEVAAKVNPSIGKEITPSRLQPRQVQKRKWWGKRYTKTEWDQIDAVSRDKDLGEVGAEPVLGMNLIGMEALTGDQEGSKYKLNLTRDDWLRSMVNEDKLSKSKDKRFEGMGAYGDSTDIEVLEDVAENAVEKSVSELELGNEHSDDESEIEAPKPQEAPLFELRGLGDMFGINQDITLDSWTDKVREVFAIVDDVNQKSFKPGGKPTVPDDVDNPGGWTRV
ncbi:MAG: DUF4157 domain-containing protein [Caldilineaceae bacterium]|nr:DUF4157 domain-containing protein [Caldilineaceae bacterium]